MESDTNFKKEKISNLFNMVDEMYDKISFLLEKKITLFQYEQEYIYTICNNNESNFLEYRDATKFIAKNSIISGGYITKEYLEKENIAKELKNKTGNFWDGMSTFYERNFHYLRIKEAKKFYDLQEYFNLKIFEGIKDEYFVHQNNLHLNYDLKKTEHRLILVKEIMEDFCIKNGFVMNDKKSNKKFLVYTKPYTKEWSIFIGIAINDLNFPIEESFRIKKNPGYMLTLPISPKFSMCFGWVGNKKIKITDDSPYALILRFEWFLPIRKAPLWSNYSSFYSLDQLESLVNINLLFYSIIASNNSVFAPSP